MMFLTSFQPLCSRDVHDFSVVRGPYDKSRGLKAIHMVNAFATANGVCLAQSKVNEKTNEITEIPKFLDMLDITVCLVTIDAMGCQTFIGWFKNKNKKQKPVIKLFGKRKVGNYELVRTVGDTYGLHAYVISNSGARKLLGLNEKIVIPIDEYTNSKYLNCYMVNEPLASICTDNGFVSSTNPTYNDAAETPALNWKGIVAEAYLYFPKRLGLFF